MGITIKPGLINSLNVNCCSVRLAKSSANRHNMPFATNHHMVQNALCWRASSLSFPHWDVKTKRPQPVKLDWRLFYRPSAGIIMSLPSSMADFKPCDRLLEKAYLSDIHFFLNQVFNAHGRPSGKSQKVVDNILKFFSRFRRFSPLPTVIKGWSNTKLNRGGETGGDKRLFQERSWRF